MTPPDRADQAPTTLSAPKIAYTSWTLENGLRVVAIRDESTANVTTSVWYEVGSKHDPDRRSGFAHLFEHILSRKTVNMPYNMINRLTEDVGGSRNASTWIDRTNYFETVPAQYLETMLWTHRERMANPVVDAEVFEKERSVVKEELRQRVLAPPYGRLQRFVIPENAYDLLPMRRPGIGSIEDLDAASLEDARGFHEAFYGPDTATLIVAGNFEVEKLRALVERYFADIPPRANPAPLAIDVVEPERTKPRRVDATAPNVPLPVVGNIWKGPKVTHADSAAIEVLSAILSRGDNSRLHKALVRSGKAVSAAHFDMLSEDGGAIVGYAVLSPSADLAGAEAALNEEIARLRDEPVSAAELIEAKNELFSSALARRETAQGRAFELGEALVSTGDLDAADKRLEAIAAVSIEDVQRVARRYLADRSKVALTYRAGKDDPSSYANPVPMPKFAPVPKPSRAPLALREESEREAPPPPSAPPEIKRAQFVEFALPNGIETVVAKTGDVPMATITLVFPGGDSSDSAQKAGVAGFAAGLIDKGTPSQSATQIAARLESLGASLGASTGPDGTYVSLTAPLVNLEAAGEVLTDVVQNANYPAEEFERERKRALDGFSATLKDPGSLASIVATRVLYGDAPYGRVANPTSLAAITREDLVAHRQTFWHPRAARIVVSGGIAPEQAHALLEDLFGSWKTDRALPPTIERKAGDPLPPRTVVIDMKGAGQAAVRAGVRAIERRHPRFYELWLANTVLGSGSRGWLFEEVRTKRGLSYGAYSTLGQRADDAPLFAVAQTKNETADEVAKLFFEQFARLAGEPVDEDTLEKRRLFLSGAFSRSLETSRGFNGIVAGLIQRALPPAEAFALSERLRAVSPQDVAAAARDFLRPERASLVVVGDASAFLEDLKALRGEVEVIAIDELDLSSPDLRKRD